MTALARRLGYDDDTKLVIISCDDLGACHSANVGVYGALRDGVATCASIMVPAPWARDAALRYVPTDDIGVHLTLNCEYEAYRFGPITHAPSLLSGEAGFPRHIADLWEHADTERFGASAVPNRTALRGTSMSAHLTPHLPHHIAAGVRRCVTRLAWNFASPSACRPPSPLIMPCSRFASCDRKGGFPTTSTTTGSGSRSGVHEVRTLQPGVTDPRTAVIDTLEPALRRCHCIHRRLQLVTTPHSKLLAAAARR